MIFSVKSLSFIFDFEQVMIFFFDLLDEDQDSSLYAQLILSILLILSKNATHRTTEPF